MLYFAYGMNTNPGEMAHRCPGATSLGHARLINHAFRFAQHADVELTSDSFVDGVLWEINEQHLAALDLLEGYPHYYDLSLIHI
jgi:gamma-glutamylcyclotransferase